MLSAVILAADLLVGFGLVVAAILASDRRTDGGRRPVRPVDQMWSDEQIGPVRQAMRQMASTGKRAPDLDTIRLNPRRGVVRMPTAKPDELPTRRPAARSHRRGDSGRWRR